MAGITLLTPAPVGEFITFGSIVYAYNNWTLENFTSAYIGFLGTGLSILALQYIKK